MPRPRRPWFRFYVEAIHDRKLRRLPAAQRWVWVVVLALARQSPVPGMLLLAVDGEDVEPLEVADIADAAAVKPKDVREGLDAFERLGMLEIDEGLGALRVTKWSERQYESDDVTERTRKHRSNERRRNVPTSLEGTPPENREQRTENHAPDGDGDAVEPPSSEPLEKRLADELREEHGVTFEQRDTLREAYGDLLAATLDHLPVDRHHGASIGVIAGLVRRVTGLEITRESRSHTARLVRTHDPLVVLDAFGVALDWGAGIKPEYAQDALSLSKYVAGVLAKRGGKR